MYALWILAARLLHFGGSARPQSNGNPANNQQVSLSVALGSGSAIRLKRNTTVADAMVSEEVRPSSGPAAFISISESQASPDDKELALALRPFGAHERSMSHAPSVFDSIKQAKSFMLTRARDDGSHETLFAQRHPDPYHDALVLSKDQAAPQIVGIEQVQYTSHGGRKFDRPALANFSNIQMAHPLEPPKGNGHYMADLALLYRELDPHPSPHDKWGQVAKTLKEDSIDASMASMALDEWMKTADWQRRQGNLEWHQNVAKLMDYVKDEKAKLLKTEGEDYPGRLRKAFESVG